jgi:hypothetical protein
MVYCADAEDIVFAVNDSGGPVPGFVGAIRNGGVR